MAVSKENVPHSVYLVADNLDAALASGEDLIAASGNWITGEPSDPGVAGTQRWALSRFRAHELNLVGRLVQAREHIEELGGEAPRFRPLARLFVAATDDLDAAFPELNEQVEANFETGGGMTAYLRSRGLVDAEAPGLGPDERPEIGDTFLVAGKVQLGVCLDLISEFLDALDVAFDLYPTAPEGVPEELPKAAGLKQIASDKPGDSAAA